MDGENSSLAFGESDQSASEGKDCHCQEHTHSVKRNQIKIECGREPSEQQNEFGCKH
ncbi:MAG: hypothetical protein ACLFTW_15390 [Chitinispirillaceae bacterium]